NLLTAQIISSDIATAGSAVVTVVNPAPGGGTSNAVNFPIAARTAGQSSLMMQRGIQPLPGMTNFHSNKPVRFLGWKLASRLGDRKSTRLNSSHQIISYAVFCLKKKTGECGPG